MSKNKAKTIEEIRFSNHNWVSVLDEIWRSSPNGYGRGTKGIDDTHPLVKRLKITPYDLTMILSFMEEQKLIEYDQAQHNWITVTPKGFDVALQNRSARNADKINKGSLFLSLAVAIFALTSLLLGIDDLYTKWFISILVVIAMIVGGLTITKI